MNERRERLWLRRQELLLRSDELRDRLELRAHALAPLFRVADGTLRTGRWLRAHPLLLVAALGLLAWRRPRGLVRWTRRGWRAWQWWRGAPTLLGARLAALAELFGRASR